MQRLNPYLYEKYLKITFQNNETSDNDTWKTAIASIELPKNINGDSNNVVLVFGYERLTLNKDSSNQRVFETIGLRIQKDKAGSSVLLNPAKNQPNWLPFQKFDIAFDNLNKEFQSRIKTLFLHLGATDLAISKLLNSFDGISFYHDDLEKYNTKMSLLYDIEKLYGNISNLPFILYDNSKDGSGLLWQKMNIWLIDTFDDKCKIIGTKYKEHFFIILFQAEEDAIMFKLKWM